MKADDYGKSGGHLDATFAALANPTRRAILARLASGELSVTQLRYVWRKANGRKMGMGGVFREVEPPARIVHTDVRVRSSIVKG
jgi:hypothetical protein